ncbi:hypothetical protein KC343_g1440 [Hortaea werneckii]|nr:hypothetical protein KC338_g9445 [Hortaea werneckii]KAI6854184.1 hypothetical protein KC323_g8935 [Hortaea werneckii]KAI7282341.1 hypothetical protein KC352_g6159 [Hortaea werneckii]KAI7289366.1 hypothetical protein KC340_g17705 [Hortaea werneckii]KAI7571431.1 hypothetical protein KC317_g1638 [Hortaea werneckii]
MPISLSSLDGTVVEFGDEFEQQSALLDTPLLLRSSNEEPINVNISTTVLRAIGRWSRHHGNDAKPGSSRCQSFANVVQWDWDFMKDKHPILADMIMATNFLKVTSLLKFCCKEASRTLEAGNLFDCEEAPEDDTSLWGMFSALPPELKEMIRKEAARALIEDLEDQGVFGAYLIRRGVRSERVAKMDEIDDGFHMLDTLSDTTENGICLYRKYDAPQIDMIRLREITKAGQLVGHPRFKPVDLPTYDRPELVSCCRGGEDTHPSPSSRT